MMLRVEKLQKYYITCGQRLEALASTSFELRSGECLALEGPSGSGKTTLLNIIGCLVRPSAGRVYIDGREITALPEHFLVEVRRRMIGFIFQQFYLLPDFSVLDNLVLPLLPLGMPSSKRRQRAEELLERFGLAGKAGARAGELSGGEQQRVAIARALVNEPMIVLADEPTSNVDAECSRLVLEVLEEQKARGRLVLVASHDPLVLESSLVDRVYRMRRVR